MSNVNAAMEVKKRVQVFDRAWMKFIPVLFLQAIDSDASKEADWDKEWEGKVVLSHNTILSGGVCFLFSR